MAVCTFRFSSACSLPRVGRHAKSAPMVNITPDTLAAIGETVLRENERSESHRRAQTVIELATLSLLIERNLLTVEDVASRIAEIHSGLPETFREPLVLEQTGFGLS